MTVISDGGEACWCLLQWAAAKLLSNCVAWNDAIVLSPFQLLLCDISYTCFIRRRRRKKKLSYLSSWEHSSRCVCPCCVFAHLRALRGGMAETLPTGLGPTAGGIITSRPGEGLEPWLRAGLAVGEATLAGLRGRGLWGGKGDGLGCSSDTN